MAGDEMSLFQRRHFMWIAATAAEMKLTDEQFNVLMDKLRRTNINFDSNRFRGYYNERL